MSIKVSQILVPFCIQYSFLTHHKKKKYQTLLADRLLHCPSGNIRYFFLKFSCLFFRPGCLSAFSFPSLPLELFVFDPFQVLMVINKHSSDSQHNQSRQQLRYRPSESRKLQLICPESFNPDSAKCIGKQIQQEQFSVVTLSLPIPDQKNHDQHTPERFI